MTKLLANLSMLGPRLTGPGVYAQMCLANLAERFELELISSKGFPSHLPKYAILPERIAARGGLPAVVQRQRWLRTLSFDEEIFVYSPTHHPLEGVREQVVTIHDLVCLHFPRQHFLQYLYFKFVMPRLLQKCAAVFTVSETTRYDIAGTYRFPLERIFVVPHAIDATVFDRSARRTSSRPFLLMVGARDPHRNVDEVLAMARHWKARYRLVVAATGQKYASVLRHQAAQLKLAEDVEVLEHIAREDLLNLYAKCDALLQPSHWDGFAMQPLEALAAGARVIASDIPAHREVLGDACDYVTLGHPDSWEGALFRLDDIAMAAAQRRCAGEVLRKYSIANSGTALQQSLLSVSPALAGALR